MRPFRPSTVRDQHWPPGATVGLLGGGQLGRMMAMAAARMGYRTHVFTDHPHTPAGEVAVEVTVASFSDRVALERFADAVQVITYEFENVPLAAARVVAERVAVRPDPNVLAIAQDRLAEKDFLSRAALAVAPYQGIETPEELSRAVEVGFPAVLKTRREGYDGKGQVRVETERDLPNAWQRLGTVPSVLERWIDFEREISVIIARSEDGEEAAYEPTENQHADGILRASIVPALISPATADAAVSAARKVVRELQCAGVLAVEMFVLADGSVVVNEIAPRPHNSGHWTIDAAETSQFEQQVRVCCGLPLGSVNRLHDAVMRNLIGADVDTWNRYLGDGRDRLHLYGKKVSRPGRKMGHVTRLFPFGSNPRAFGGDAGA
ncbi:MAG: 5-(carboxyamino)imidazole ribonucleotide synthase [Alphaproteobacteria bacterium]|nr:5-(carboxyamino)imidazole ribonucleotide synthase [Alphaproteobacteria bacterium]